MNENNNENSMEQRLEKALNDLFEPFIKYFETKECMLAFNLVD